jgi:hypothetical protein
VKFFWYGISGALQDAYRTECRLTITINVLDVVDSHTPPFSSLLPLPGHSIGSCRLRQSPANACGVQPPAGGDYNHAARSRQTLFDSRCSMFFAPVATVKLRRTFSAQCPLHTAAVGRIQSKQTMAKIYIYVWIKVARLWKISTM